MNSIHQVRVRNWSISARLLLGFGLIILFVIGLAVISLSGLLSVQQAVDNALTEGLRIQGLGNRIQNDLTEARRQEQAFLLHWQEEGYQNAVNTYLIPHGNSITDIRQAIVDLDELTASQERPLFTHINPKLTGLSTALTTYRNEFNATTNLLQERGTNESGAIGKLEKVGQELISQSNSLAQPELLTLSLRLRLIEKEYRVYGRQTDRDTVNLTLEQFRTTLAKIDEPEAPKMTALLELYEAAFVEVVRLDAQINAHIQQYTTAAEAIQPLALDIAASGTEFADEQLASVTYSTQRARAALLAAALVSVALGSLLSFSLARQISRPLHELTEVALEIGRGNLQARAKIKSNDEIGTLATTFNSMTSQLRDLIGSLEQRVEQRTAQLELTSQQSEKRVQELQTITEIARYISTEKDLVKLLPLVTRSVSERFGFYHVGIFLLDDTGKYAVLRASNSPGGQEMLRLQHRLEVGQTGIVGNVTASGSPRIALDTGADAIYFNNPHLPNTRSEMALPLTAHGSIIGALDVQSETPNAFTDADISILALLADQIVIAIDNARLIEEVQSALAESQTLFNQYITEAWQRKTTRGILGYHQTRTGGEVITDLTQDPYKEHTNEHKSLEIPIRVRDQVIGQLDIRSLSKETEWSADDLSIVDSIAERLGLALDNARLFEETSTRASRERLVSDITTKLRGTNDPQEMIKTAVEELKRALGATRVEIVPNSDKPKPKRI